MRRIVQGLERLSEVGGYLAGAMVLGLTVFVASAVLARRVLGTPILASDEVVQAAGGAPPGFVDVGLRHLPGRAAPVKLWGWRTVD